jgi:hypothetical protein
MCLLYLVSQHSTYAFLLVASSISSGKNPSSRQDESKYLTESFLILTKTSTFLQINQSLTHADLQVGQQN